ncbi:hypothetical protein [Yinghuangia seranimata]|uniref:hypothetical protein n=1 Tax=Yinghuangia seranimata TaxID=408067 RepID=UPI00248C81C7|nr:hypothetical protein [Yinghuangia seranimata]MDI2132474.1 hypothetical protein [Yinghuangia seranimata]
MGSMYQVDIDQMRAMITKLNTAEQSMRDAMAAMHSTGGADNVGTKKLDDACNDFQKHWKYGLDQIHKDIESTLKGLDDAMKNYEEIEKALADLFTQTGGDKK